MNAVSLRREGYVDIITLQRPPINALVWGKGDWKEGISALMQKRDPEFSGNKQMTDCCNFSGNRFQPK